MKGYVHSLQSLGTVDGPGVRAVVFAAGCPLRCAFCHNPDTWKITEGTPTEDTELKERIMRLYPYIKNGGVTFSGGEPLMQAEFFASLAKMLKDAGLHIAVDTSGCIMNEDTDKLLKLCDLVLLDLKFTTEKNYKDYTGGSLSSTLSFLDKLKEKNKPTVIRQVIIPGLTDTEQSIKHTAKLLLPYRSIICQVELLPFRKLCLEKYEALGIEFPFKDKDEADFKRVKLLQKLINSELNL